MRVKITLSYDGSFFNGFQIQKDEKGLKISVLGTLIEALKNLNIAQKPVGSGRTDVDVHALHQVMHLDLPSFWKDTQKLKKSLNDLIKPHIFIQKIETVSPHFHARYSAQKRLYRYILYDGAYLPMLAHYALHVEKPLEVEQLNQSAKCFEGKHNFALFKKRDGGKTKDDREIFKAGAYRHHDLIVIYFLGDAFLRSQVRLMCGFLLKIAQGELSDESLTRQLEGKEKISNRPALACGLYLCHIYYPTPQLS